MEPRFQLPFRLSIPRARHPGGPSLGVPMLRLPASPLRPVLGLLGALALLGLGLACSASGGSRTVLQKYGAYHPASWVDDGTPTHATDHQGQAQRSLADCRDCHSMTKLQVGPAPSCMTAACHHDTVPDFALPERHGALAKQAVGPAGGFQACQICHGADYAGAKSGTDCFTCHEVRAPHPKKPWRDELNLGSVVKHSDTDGSNAPTCAVCHFPGSPSNPVDAASGRRYPLTAPAPGAMPDCFNNTLCHGAMGHAVPFTKGLLSDKGFEHFLVDQAAFTSDCATCHALTGTSPKTSAPACVACHTATANSVVAPATGRTTCLSCHATSTPGMPLGPTGTIFPDIAGSHPKHMALAGVACSACHFGVEAGSLAHYNAANARKGTPVGPAPVAFDPKFNAKSGAAAWSAANLTCSNVSCHGGQTAPNWRTGVLDASNVATSNTYCNACHAYGTGQYNSYNSGGGDGHQKHVLDKRFLCAECHNVRTGPAAAAHFAALGTPAMEGPASGSIAFPPSVTGNPSSSSPVYDPPTRGCALTCHSENHSLSNNRW